VIRVAPKEPNFLCVFEERDGAQFASIVYASSEASLRAKLHSRGLRVLQIQPYDFTEWKSRAARATSEIIAAVDSGAAKTFNESLWRYLKTFLFGLFHDKCAYCESEVLHVASGDVEHYRPKRCVIEDPQHPGYYWLAYDVSNLLPCCEQCNRIRGKRNHFPIAGTRGNRGSDLAAEEPLLLNPYAHDPKDHIVWPVGASRPGGAPPLVLGTAVGSTEVGRTSIEIYNLNRGHLVERRRRAQEQILERLYYHVRDPDQIRAIFQDLAAGKVEYSAAVLAQARHWWEELSAAVND
jgi:hypothetical protein